jgi:hypothetical protein
MEYYLDLTVRLLIALIGIILLTWLFYKNINPIKRKKFQNL